MLDNLPNEVIKKIYFYTAPTPSYLAELKRIIKRISQFNKSLTYIENIVLKVQFRRSKTKEIVYLNLDIFKRQYNESDFFDLNVSQAILLCLDKYVPVDPGYYFDRRFSVMCSKF